MDNRENTGADYKLAIKVHYTLIYGSIKCFVSNERGRFTVPLLLFKLSNKLSLARFNSACVIIEKFEHTTLE